MWDHLRDARPAPLRRPRLRPLQVDRRRRDLDAHRRGRRSAPTRSSAASASRSRPATPASTRLRHRRRLERRATGGFYKSTDGGTTFTPRADVDSPSPASFVYGWWFGRVWVDPKDADHVFVAGVGAGRVATTAALTFGSTAHGRAARRPARDGVGPEGARTASTSATTAASTAPTTTARRRGSSPSTSRSASSTRSTSPSRTRRRMVAGLQDNGVEPLLGRRRRRRAGTSTTAATASATLIKPDRPEHRLRLPPVRRVLVSHRRRRHRRARSRARSSRPRKNWFDADRVRPRGPERRSTPAARSSAAPTDDGETFDADQPRPDQRPGPRDQPAVPQLRHAHDDRAGRQVDGHDLRGHRRRQPLVHARPATRRRGRRPTDPDLPKAWITRVEVDPREPEGRLRHVLRLPPGDDAAYVLRTTDGGRRGRTSPATCRKAPRQRRQRRSATRCSSRATSASSSTRDAGATWLQVGRNLPLAPIFELRYHARDEPAVRRRRSAARSGRSRSRGPRRSRTSRPPPRRRRAPVPRVQARSAACGSCARAGAAPGCG